MTARHPNSSAKKPKKHRPTNVLVITSHGTPSGCATPVIADLAAAGHRVRAMDVGRIGARHQGTVERVIKAISAEFTERRLARELSANSPDVAVAFDPGSVRALLELRRHSSTSVVVVAVVAELDPDPAWFGVKADRFLAVDSEAAVNLADGGVSAVRIMTVGPVVTRAYADAGRQKRKVVRARFGLPLSESVVLANVEGLGSERATQLALQLSLLDRPMMVLFAAGGDIDVANALRRQVPTLSLRAKLFGRTEDAALLWRASDVVIASPTPEIAQRVLILNTKMIALAADDVEGIQIAAALEDREMGGAAANTLMVSGALEAMLAPGHSPSSSTGTDGAANIADIVAIVGRDKSGVVRETQSAKARSWTGANTARSASDARDAVPRGVPQGLEDLSGGIFQDLSSGFSTDGAHGSDAKGTSAQTLARLRAKMEQLGKTVGAAQDAAEQWETKKDDASERGDLKQAKSAARKAAEERASMHRMLKEMSRIEGQLRKLEGRDKPRRTQGRQSSARGQSPKNMDDLFNEMKKDNVASVDDELAALKRKMTGKRGKR